MTTHFTSRACSPPEQSRSPIARKQKRTSNACEVCRQSKVKCSGQQPCNTCQRRSLECIFLEESKKVAVSARYLSTLKSQARARDTGDSPPPQPISDFVVEPTSHTNHRPSNYRPLIELQDGIFGEQPVSQRIPSPTSPVMSPLSEEARVNTASDHETWNPFSSSLLFLRNKRGSRRAYAYLAPSSTWGFNLRLTSMMLNHLNPGETNDIPFSLCGDAYPLQFKSVSTTTGNTPNITGLPSQDYTIYLFNTVKFHLGQTFRFFDEDTFMQHVQEFYENAPEKASQSRLWFSQFLLMLAFGRCFLSSNSSTTSNEPPGGPFFERAMVTMPNILGLWDDPILAVETYSLVALYLYSIDMRESAYLYIRQAVGIGVMEGLHLDFPPEIDNPKVSQRRSQLWWSCYILDQRISSSLGGLVSIPDNTITLNSPSDSSQRDIMLNLHVQVSRLICKVLQTVYSKEAYTSHLELVKSVLQEMAILARSLEEAIQLKFKSSVDTLPKGTIHAILAFHHCAILVIRPLLLVALKERLDKPGYGLRTVSTTFKSLIKTLIQSASRTLKILTYLLESSLLDTFLPFDLDFTVSSVTALTTIQVLFPNMVPDSRFSSEADKILDEMISKGNRLAQLRKADLKRLREVFQSLLDRGRMPRSSHTVQRLPRPVLSSSPQNMTSGITGPSTQVPNVGYQEPFQAALPGMNMLSWSPTATNDYAPGNATTYTDLLNQIGVSSNDMSFLANQIDFSVYQAGNDWLWDPVPPT